MYTSFPVSLVSLIRCQRDGVVLHLRETSGVSDGRISTGTLQCQSCGRCYPITDGVVNMLDPTSLEGEGEIERRARDEWAEKIDESADSHDYAIGTSLSMLGPFGGACLEMGCGAGRFTTLIADKFTATLAVDFSGASLRVLARRLDCRANVGLVHADITRLEVERGRFDRCFSTLVSNLPTREHRAAMMRLAVLALHPGGRFVYSTHHHCLRSRWKKIPQEGRYARSGIYRYNFMRREVLEEAQPFFGRLRVVRRSIYLPSVLGRLGRVTRALSWAAERFPVADQLGGLLVVSAEQPLPATTPAATKDASGPLPGRSGN